MADYDVRYSEFSASYQSRIMAVVATMLEAELSKGGKTYDKLVKGAIKGGEEFYGLYKPKVYQRGETLSKEEYIDVSIGDMRIDGWEITCSVSTQHKSPHLGWTSGFFLKCINPRNNSHWRDGFDVHSMIDTDLEVELDISPSIKYNCIRLAAQDAGLV